MGYNKYFIIILALFLVLPLLSSVEQSLGVFELGECLTLKQTCANCTFVNISSISYPNSTQAMSEGVMTQTGTVYNKTFCSTLALGEYIVNGHGDIDGIDTTWTYNFIIAPAYAISTGISVFYIGILVVLCFLFILCIIGIGALPNQDPIDSEGKIMSINNLKYFRYILGALAWGVLVIISFIIFNFAEGYLSEGLLLAVFSMMFKFLMITAMIGIPVILFFMFSKFMQDIVIKRMIERNIMS